MEATAESFAAKMRELAAGYNADFRLTAAAVSGGADSLALAFLLKDFQKQNGGRAAVLTVNHHLRPEADAEAAMVAALMKKWGIEHHVLNWFPEEGNGGIEEKAPAICGCAAAPRAFRPVTIRWVCANISAAASVRPAARTRTTITPACATRPRWWLPPTMAKSAARAAAAAGSALPKRSEGRAGGSEGLVC